jgi:hypothetical protein
MGAKMARDTKAKKQKILRNFWAFYDAIANQDRVDGDGTGPEAFADYISKYQADLAIRFLRQIHSGQEALTCDVPTPTPDNVVPIKPDLSA